MNTAKPFHALLCGSALLIASTAGLADTAPSGLMCELLENPEMTTLADFQPEFTWIVNHGSRQTAFHILVASSESLLAENKGDLWDSGKVQSDQSINVVYAGKPLKPNSTCFWKVQTWNEQDKPGGWSDAQKFTMADQPRAHATATYPLVTTEIKPVKVAPLSDNHYFVDFGKDAFGYLTLTVDSLVEGTQIVVHFGEKANGPRIDRNPGGTIRYYRVPVTLQTGLHTYQVHPPVDKRNTGRDAIPIPESIGVIAPFRYVEIEDCPVPIDASMLTQQMVHYPFNEDAGVFTSSDSILNRVWDLCKYSIKATTFCGIYVDGDRERIPYEADAYINQLCHYGVDREYSLARASHEYLLERPTWPTEWKQHSVLMAWEDYMYTGNAESLAAHYGTLKKDKTLDQYARPDGLLNTGKLRDIVDWPEGERDKFDFKPVNAVVNAFHYRTLVLMAQIAEALDKPEDARAYARTAEQVYDAYQDVFYNSDTGLYVDGEGSGHSSLHTNMFALAFDLVPADKQTAVADFLVSKGMACSVYGAQYLLEALYKTGRADAALDRMTTTDKRGWVNMLKAGSTITLEAWDIEFKPNLDWNHAWGAAPANIIPRWLMGIRPLEPGFEKVLIEPQPAGLRAASIVNPTIRGPISMQFKHDPQRSLRLQVTLPANMTAQVVLPRFGEENTLYVDGQKKEARPEDGRLVLDNLEPGTRIIEAK